jgi:WD40 repeat protein
MRTFRVKNQKRQQGIHFSADGKHLLAVGSYEVRGVDSVVWLDVATGENLWRIDEYCNWYAVDPQLSRLVVTGANEWDGLHPIQFKGLPAGDGWHPFPDTYAGKVKLPEFESPYGIAFDSSGEWIALTHGWTVPRRSRSEPEQAQYELCVLQFEPAKLIKRISLTTGSGVLAFNTDATRIAITGGMDGDTAASVFDVKRGKLINQFTPPSTVTRCVLFLPDNRLVVANGRIVYVLPADRPEPQFTLLGHPKQVNAVTLTPDGRRILTASHDGTIKVWNTDTGEATKAFDWQIGSVTAVAFAPDGLTCAAAGIGGKIVVWDVDS